MEYCGKMSEKTLRNIIKKASYHECKECVLAFQGGEPTLAGLDFFQKAVEYEKELAEQDIRFVNTIQTNGYGLDKEWVKFFAENQFLVGVSLDGTSYTHNAYRRTKEELETFEPVMQFIGWLKEYNVKFNILTVVTEKMAFSAKRIYRFFTKNQFYNMQFIPCIDPLDGERSECSLTAKGYGRFLCELFDEWYADILAGKRIYIRQFEDYLLLAKCGRAESCGTNGRCGIQYVIEADGGIYPCDFYVLDQYCLGNINQISYQESEKRGQQIEFFQKSREIPPECSDCPYYLLCRNGCFRYREKDFLKNKFCESYKDFFAYAGDRLIWMSRW